MDPTIKTVVAQMTRDDIVRVLEEQGGYQCYDSEATEDLRNTLLSDIEAGNCEYDLSAFEPRDGAMAHPFRRW